MDKKSNKIFSKDVILRQIGIALIPIILLIIALLLKNFLLLDYVHVLSGAIWTGIDIFMGVILSRIMKSLDVPSRVEIAKRLTPKTLFLLPSLAGVTITAGLLLAKIDGYFHPISIWVILALIVVAILTIQGFAILLPNSIRILFEITKKKQPNLQKIAKLNMLNLKLSASQAFFQVIIIFIMANLAVGHH
jgi:hypothetical protein